MKSTGVVSAAAVLLLLACGTGSSGPQGPAGDAGPPGPAASVRFRLVVGTLAASQSNGSRIAAAMCPAGSKVIGGSCTCTPAQVHVSASETISLGGIGAIAEEHICECDAPPTVTDWTVTAQATCVDGSGATVE